MDVFTTNEALLDALRGVVDLPDRIVSLKLEMGDDRIATFEIVHEVDIQQDVTNDDSTARVHARTVSPVTRRYELMPI